MLLSLRDRVKGSKVLGTVVVVVISIPFALVGIGSYLSGGGDYAAAEVNGEEISIQAYEQNYYAQRSQLQSALGGTIPPEFDSAGYLRRQALETSITRELLTQHTQTNGYATSDTAIAAALYQEDAFHGEDQKFSKERYELQLQSLGISATQFEAQLRQDLSINQMREGVVFTAFQTQQEHSRISALTNQTRTYSSLLFSDKSIGTIAEPTASEIEEYFSANSSRFQHPERVKIAYIELDQSTLGNDIEVDTDDLEQMYIDNQSAYVTPEQRRAAHILLLADEGTSQNKLDENYALLEQLRDRITAGESFADLAREYSEDPGSAEQGGDLGAFARGVMVPEFEEAAFALEEGGLSDIVKSSFGLHLIQLNEIIPQQGKSFEQAKTEVEQAYRQREAENLFFERSDSLANQVYENSDSLAPAADATGLSVIESDWLNANSVSGVFRFNNVKQAAFSEELREEGVNSDVIEVGDNHVVVLRVLDYEAARPQALDEVNAQIVSALKAAAKQEALSAKAQEAIDSLQAGTGLSEVAANSNAEIRPEATAGRTDSSIDNSILGELFRMPKPDNGPVYSAVRLLNGDYAVLVLSSIKPGEVSVTGSAQDEQQGGQREYIAWLAAMRERASVTINNQLLDEVATQR